MGKEAVREFKSLVDPKDDGGRRRREILSFVGKQPRCTAYKIAKVVYGAPLKCHKTVVYHLTKLREVSNRLGETDYGKLLSETRRKDGAVEISLTEAGKELCRMEGIKVPSGRVDEFIGGFNRELKLPLVPEQVKKLRELLSDSVIDALCDIAGRNRKVVSMLFESTKVPENEVWRILFPLWMYEVETREVSRTLKGLVYFYASEMGVGREAKRIAPKTLPEIEAEMRKIYKATPVVEMKGLTDSFKKLIDFFNEILADELRLFILLKKEAVQGEYKNFLLLSPQIEGKILKTLKGGEKT